MNHVVPTIHRSDLDVACIDFAKFGLFDRALIGGEGAAGVEVAAGWGVGVVCWFAA